MSTRSTTAVIAAAFACPPAFAGHPAQGRLQPWLSPPLDSPRRPPYAHRVAEPVRLHHCHVGRVEVCAEHTHVHGAHRRGGRTRRRQAPSVLAPALPPPQAAGHNLTGSRRCLWHLLPARQAHGRHRDPATQPLLQGRRHTQALATIGLRGAGLVPRPFHRSTWPTLAGPAVKGPKPPSRSHPTRHADRNKGEEGSGLTLPLPDGARFSTPAAMESTPLRVMRADSRQESGRRRGSPGMS